jgi:hypothetical protein
VSEAITFFSSIGVSTLLAAALIFLTKNLISQRIKNAIEHEYSIKLERHKSELIHGQEAFKSSLKESETVKQARWELKRQACLEALDVVDALFANVQWNMVSPEIQPVPNIGTIRKCYNALALSCNSPAVLTEFKRCLGLGQEKSIRADMIVDLRNAIRKELEFGQEVDTDRVSAWIARVNPHIDENL